MDQFDQFVRTRPRLVRRIIVNAAILSLSFVALACGGSSGGSTGTGLWVTNFATASSNSLEISSGRALEFNAAALSKPGVTVAAQSLTNASNDFGGPAGITFDGQGDQWIAVDSILIPVLPPRSNRPVVGLVCCGNIAEFRFSTLQNLPENSKPTADVIVSDDGSGNSINRPTGLIFRHGNLWVADGGGFVAEFLSGQLTKSGSPTPNITLTVPGEFESPSWVAFDSAGDLFVADSGAGKIWVFKAATVAALSGKDASASDASLSDPTMKAPFALASDKLGNLWVTDEDSNEILMFPQSSLLTTTTAAGAILGSTTVTIPNGSAASIDLPMGIAFDRNGNLWYANVTGTSTSTYLLGSIAEFSASQLPSSGTTSPAPSLLVENSNNPGVFSYPFGIAFGPAL